MTPRTAAHQAPSRSPSPGICSDLCPLSWWCYLTISPLSPPSPRALNLSQHQGLFSESVACIRGPKYWSFSFSTNPSSEYSRLISIRMDGFDLLAVQRTLKSFLQHHNLKVSVLQHSAFFMFQLLHLCMTTGKTIALCQAPLSFDYKDKYAGKWIALRIW